MTFRAAPCIFHRTDFERYFPLVWLGLDVCKPAGDFQLLNASKNVFYQTREIQGIL